MQYRRIGSTEIEASVIGFGAWGIGGWMWGGVYEDQATRAIHAALDHGINLIDTAPMYGMGLSEELIGKAIRDRRSEVVLASKCGIPWDTKKWPEGKGNFHFHASKEGLSAGEAEYRFYRYLNPDSIKREVDASLQRLQTDHLDILMTHAQEDTTPIADTMGALEELRTAGKVRAIGCCNVTLDQLNEYRCNGTLDVVQERFNLIDRHVCDTGVVSACEEHAISFFAYSPLEHGLLSGNLDPDFEYPEGDFRGSSASFAPESVRRMNQAVGRMASIAQKYKASVAQLMLAWVVAQNDRSHALCGIRSESRALENGAAGAIVLDPSDCRKMEELAVRGGIVASSPKGVADFIASAPQDQGVE